MKNVNDPEMKRYFSVLTAILLDRELPALSKEETESMIGLSQAFCTTTVLAASESFLSLCEPNAAALLSLRLFKTVQKQIRQEFEYENLCEKLRKADVRFLPLKGIVSRHLYPQKEMRPSSDVDLFYDRDRRKEIRTIMAECGFELDHSDPNHDVFVKNEIKIEMHHNLTCEAREWEHYYDHIWQRLRRENGSEYRFSPEDFYIFHLMHTRKHFITGVLDFRFLLDMILMRKKWQLDPAYLIAELEKLHLRVFEERMRFLAEVIAGEREADAKDQSLFDFAFVHKKDQSLAFSAYQNKERGGTLRYAFSKLFPSYHYMSEKYLSLQRFPVLLPFYYIGRIFRYLFGEKKVKVNALDRNGGAVELFRELEL